MSGQAPGDGGDSGGRVVSAGAPAFGDAGPRAAAVAHDVNNLLAVIAATAAEALVLPGLDEAARQAFAEVGDATGRAAVLLRRLLDPLPRSGGCGVAGVDAALRAMAAPLRRVLGGVALVVAPGAPGAAVAMEPVDLDRVVLNLVLNARNAMPSSGGTVAVGSALCEVAARASQFGDAVVPGRFVVVAVRDTGAGMSPEVVARVFEPFFTTRAGEGGTGLGMAGVRDLVRGAGGFLEVDSAPGRGTTVRVHLPCHETVPEAAAAPPAVGAGRAGAGGRGVVLLVDDEAALLRLGERALSRAGWGVVAVAGAADAMAAVEGGTVVPCAAVVDLALPDGDGLALVEALRRRLPGLPAVLTSGYDTAAVRGRAGAAGVGFLAKPFATGALVGRLGEVLQPGG